MKNAFWNIAFGIFFAALVILGALWIGKHGLLGQYIPFEHMLVMALAIFRLIRLASYDVITAFIRDAVAAAPKNSFVGTFSLLLNCPWCTGLWFSFFVVFAYYASALAWPVILILALAGAASFFQLLANLIGWHAEAKKQQVHGNQ